MGRVRGGGKKGPGTKGKKGSKSKKSKKDKEWTHEGASFGGFADESSSSTHDAATGNHDDGEEGGTGPRKRRLTQGVQDQMRRGKIKTLRRSKERAVGRKFEAARRAAEATMAPPPPGKARRHRHRKGKGGEEEATQRRSNRYLWIHEGVKRKEKEEEEALFLPVAAEEAATGVGRGRGRGGEKGAYAALMAGLAKKGASSKYKELLEQRRREQEGMTESSEEEEEESGEEEEESGEEEEEEADVALEEEEEEEEEEESEDEEEELEEEEEALQDEQEEEEPEGEEEEEDENDTADPFVRHWQRGPLAEAGAEEEEGEDDIKTLATWKGPELGEEDGEDALLVQAMGAISSSPSTTPLEPTQCPHLKKLLKDNWAPSSSSSSSALPAHLFPLLSSYRDCLFAGLTYENVQEVQQITLLHLLNHTLKARARVLRHNIRRRKEAKAARIDRMTAAVQKELGQEDGWEEEEEEEEKSKKKKGGKKAAAAAAAASLEESEHEQADRDQGYTRPRVLLLLPMRSVALQAIKTMLSLLGPKTSVSGLQRLEESFGAGEEEEEEEEEAKEKDGRPRKPEDWQQLFKGNCDDDFKLGMALTPGQGKGKGAGKGVAVKLFTEFYHSDIIVASPLGLRLAIEAQGGDADFLSSIEIMCLDQADVLLMQNWDHVVELLRRLNGEPKKDHNTDFSRVRQYVLEGQAGRFRQSLFLTRYLDPALTAAFKGRGGGGGKTTTTTNHRGALRLKRVVENGATICQVALRVKQVFQRVPCAQPRLQGDARFDYMVKKVLPEIQRLQQGHTLLFIPSYYDFVRLRNYAVREELSHVCVSEYERTSETNRGRARFFHGQRDLMLYTGRAHFFKRYMMRGAHHLVFYSLPENAHFYPELVNLLEEAEGSAQVTSCFALFTKYEALALERIVGTTRTRHMLASEKSTFLFC